MPRTQETGIRHSGRDGGLQNDQTLTHCSGHGLSSCVCLKFSKNCGHVELRRVLADLEALSNGFVRQPFGQKLKHLKFSRGEILRGLNVFAPVIQADENDVHTHFDFCQLSRAPGSGSQFGRGSNKKSASELTYGSYIARRSSSAADEV